MDARALIGKTIGSYEILALAGSGGMASVLKARHIDFNRFVAIKLLSTELAETDSFERFKREAKSLSLLSNAHIATFYGFGTFVDDTPYIAMEFVEGKSLAQVLEENPQGLPLDRIIKIFVQVCEALSYAHQEGIIHRDLKPENILLESSREPDFVKIVDFGLSYLQFNNAQAETLTRTGTVVGTPQYISPEQAKGQKADARSDIYSLGCVLYQTICGVVPFECDNAMGTIYQHLNEPAVPPSAKSKRKAPEDLDVIVMKCLEKDPANRYKDMQQLKEDLEIIRTGGTVDLLQAAQRTREQAKNKRRSAVIALVGTIILSVGLGFGGAKFIEDLDINKTCTKSIANDHSLSNISNWLQKVDELLKKRKNREAERLYASLKRGLSEHCRSSLEQARQDLDLSEEFFVNKDFVHSEMFAIDVAADLHEAGKNKELSSVDLDIIDRSFANINKLIHKPKRAGESAQVNGIQKIKCELILAFDSYMLHRIDKGIEYTENATAETAALKEKNKSLPADLADHFRFLVGAFKNDLCRTVGTENKKQMISSSWAELHLFEVAQLPENEAEEKFIKKYAYMSDVFKNYEDFESVKKCLLYVLNLQDDDKEDSQTMRARLAVVEDKLGNQTPLRTLYEKQKRSGDIDQLLNLAAAHYWVGNHQESLQILEKLQALHEQGHPFEAQQLIATFRLLALDNHVSGHYKEEEKYLRKCLALTNENDVSVWIQLNNLLDSCLRSQKNNPE